MNIPGETSWPAVSYESYPWNIEPGTHLSKTAKRSVLGPYEATVTPPIQDLAPLVDRDTATEAEEASTEIGRFDAAFGNRIVAFASVLLRSESAASSQIEQLTASAKAIALAELGDPRRKNASMIVSNVRAMEAAIEVADSLDGDSIITMHAELLRNQHPEWVGHWRDQQVWIGGSAFGPHGAMFVAPHHKRVPAAMDDLVVFAHRDDISPLVHAAVTHAQFETIHPFPDGNGRTGRALVHSLLRRRGITRNVTIPISAGLLVDTAAYFDALSQYREGNIDPIVRQMTNATFLSLTAATALVKDLDAVSTGWNNKVKARSDSTAWRLAELLIKQPAVNSALVQTSLGVSAPAANNAIGKLEDAGILAKVAGDKRYRAWVATDVVSALDDFASSIGRRSKT